MSDAPDSLSSDKAKEEEINAAFAGKNPKKFNPNDPSDAANYNGPTDSHILSQTKPQDNEAKGLAHRAGENEPGQVSDIGWGSSDTVQERVVPGLSNEDLFMLIRRFNKQIYNVKAVPDAPLQGLDLVRAEDDHFSPDKLRATLERFYTTIIIGVTAFHEGRADQDVQVYFTAWLRDLLIPTIFTTLLTLVLYPPSRKFLFPPAPIALVDTSTGGVQKPKAGVLGSHDSMTGAPEKYKGEAAEQEASNLMAGIATVAVGSATGKHDQGNPEGAPMESKVPDATDIVAKSADAQAAANGEVPAETHDKTREPMKQTVLNSADQAMRVMADVIDTWERFANALSPTPPFSMMTPRLRLAGVLASGLLVALLTSSYVFMKIATFSVGLAFFGDPLIQRGIQYLNREYPHWKELSQLQNTLLKGVPTNAQLTLTLLRIGEANAAPLPPPPSGSVEKAPSQPASIDHDTLKLGAAPNEIDRAAAPEPEHPNMHQQEKAEFEKPKQKKGFGAKLLSFFRGTTAAGIESKLAISHARAEIGNLHAKNQKGVLRKKGLETLPMGPVEFDARYQGHRGMAIIDSSHEPALLYFTTDETAQLGDYRMESRKNGSVYFDIPVSDIKEMRKIGGMGWKGKLVTGWAVGGKEVVDGIVVKGNHSHQEFQLTAVTKRDELFNRLVAIDGQVWNSF
ncbi:hypothetical protein AN1625.2 [Aspergillus nidulans FGSC A4]|uniref:Uncharacterized protein n=1 Tax=Emericella nidulans (strain FGSC A4 / ATCC 38163 / CBS 112.46 / NRRL 194 / M139) TaxID=227321 RepID=Q5BCV5_EMENI|nr:hypothetical protein [Aspergillus nidulans FGSC A4]EAA64745.1 hypothetical protein AN1625.2 [Aspergillus nidulans FGSC A4]CBF85245.1 TPA: conserved hypothetical protein [Aspergillus nidulans FGSC A4]|eukprot:XP_659229.1 hypothetical protein AN1625.2 [Aspergillus nidulans FGSC A4]